MKSINSSFLFLFCLLALISLQTTCQKEEPRVLLTNDSTFLSYWYFPTNSYWIYEDSVNGELDTFRITWNNVREGPKDKYSNYQYQFHVIHVKNHGTIKYQVGQGREIDKNQFFYYLDQSWEDGFAYRFFYSKNQSIQTASEGKLNLVKQYDTLRVRNADYVQVFQMGSIPQDIDDTVKTEYYARNVGIIKRVYQNNRVWELKEYYIAP